MQKNSVLARFVKEGTTLRKWAKENRYNPRTVYQVLDRYAGTQETPRGVTGFNILRALSNEIGAEIVPGLFTPEEKAALPKSADIGAFETSADKKGDAA